MNKRAGGAGFAVDTAHHRPRVSGCWLCRFVVPWALPFSSLAGETSCYWLCGPLLITLLCSVRCDCWHRPPCVASAVVNQRSPQEARFPSSFC